MTQGSKANEGYAKGWSVNKSNNWWHGGSLPGTRTIMVRAMHGYCWAVLINNRSSKPNHYSELDRLTWNILKGVKQWPKHDLFKP